MSTVGIIPKIVEYVARSEGKGRLSISLHSADEKTRSRLVPANRKYSLKKLMEALTGIHRSLKREITFEYTLIEGVNDSKEDAERTAKLIAPLGAKINLIPYNPVRESEFRAPDKDKIEAFRKAFHRFGIRVTVRQTVGRDIRAACGQLRLDRESR